MEGYRGATRTAVLRRRAAGVAVVVALAVAVWLLLVRDDSSGGEGGRAGVPGVSAGAAQLAERLAPEQLVDQVLLLGFDGVDASAPFVGELRTRQLGGLLVGGANWTGAGAGQALISAARQSASLGGAIPPLIVGSQEGGPYRSFADLPPDQTELEVADTGSVDDAEEWARSTSEALAKAGFDLNLFPVADVATLDSPIADRAFSDDPTLAAQLTAAAVRGCRAGAVACAALHFPGLGAASSDTSRGPATVSLDEAGLSARDLEPFRAAFAERAPAVVLSLAFYAAYDPVTPAAMTEPIVGGLLRDDLGFQGVAITDDLGSGAVRSGYSPRDAALAALLAGADLIQLASPEDQNGVREALLQALADGELPRDRLVEAASRVIELKRTLGLVEM
jgi:beta-N-acetylhexosaminidase